MRERGYSRMRVSAGEVYTGAADPCPGCVKEGDERKEEGESVGYERSVVAGAGTGTCIGTAGATNALFAHSSRLAVIPYLLRRRSSPACRYLSI